MALQAELELELEDEFEDEFEDELEGEWEDEFEDEDELEYEFEDEFEGEWEDELEFEGEEFLGKFFKKTFKKVGRFVKKAAPVLRRVAKIAAPIVGTAIGGPAGSLIGGGLSRLLESEGEFEEEFEFEDEFEMEFEGEDEFEDESMAEAEFMADAAAKTKSPAQARALSGAAVVATLSASDRAVLRRVLPHMIKGTDVLTRILRSRKVTKPAVRVIPTIVKRSAKILKKKAATGKPVNRKVAGRVVAAQVKRVLGNPKTCARAMTKSLAAKRKVRRRRTVRG